MHYLLLCSRHQNPKELYNLETGHDRKKTRKIKVKKCADRGQQWEWWTVVRKDVGYEKLPDHTDHSLGG